MGRVTPMSPKRAPRGIGLTSAEIRRRAVESRRAQGLPDFIEDPSAYRAMAALLDPSSGRAPR